MDNELEELTMGEMLKDMLDDRKLTNEMLSDATGLSISTIDNICTNRATMSLRSAVAIGIYLGIDYDFLLRIQNECQIRKLKKDKEFQKMLNKIEILDYEEESERERAWEERIRPIIEERRNEHKDK